MIELCQPVLKGVDGNDAEDRPGGGVAEQNVNEGDDLHGLAQPHVVSQYAAKALRFIEPSQRLHHIVVQESHSAYLVRLDELL